MTHQKKSLYGAEKVLGEISIELHLKQAVLYFFTLYSDPKPGLNFINRNSQTLGGKEARRIDIVIC